MNETGDSRATAALQRLGLKVFAAKPPRDADTKRVDGWLRIGRCCSVLDLPTAAKYDSTMERVARAVRPLSTDPGSDILVIVKRAVFAWLIADGDMHPKNMALLKIADSGAKQFHSVRMAPLYDAVTTRVFPRLKHDRLALKLNGKDDNLRRAEFVGLATTAGLRAADAEGAIDEMSQRLRGAIDRIALPSGMEFSNDAKKKVAEVLHICRTRLETIK